MRGSFSGAEIDVTDEQNRTRRTPHAERLAAVTTLLAGLAHEIRNPLNSATLQLEVLQTRIERGQTDTASLLPVVMTVRDEMRRLDHLVSDFLNLARPRALELRLVDLNAFLTELAVAERSKADHFNVELELDLDPRVGQVELDAERIRQAVANLVENAIEASRDGGHVRLRSRAGDSGGSVRIEVEDTGPGFPEGAPVFDVFYTTKPEGTGLGLPIAHRAADDHGGTLEAAPAAGRTQLVLTLPRSQSR